MKNCKQCNDEFGGIGKYCSNACKQKAYRNANRNETLTVTRQSVTVKNGLVEQELHPDIIANIKRISKDEAEVKVRTAAALRYAELFTNRPAYSAFAKRMAQAGPELRTVSIPNGLRNVNSAEYDEVSGLNPAMRGDEVREPRTAPVMDGRTA